MAKLKTRIKELRLELDMQQAELADIVGVRRETIVNLERGKYNPSLKLAMDISKAFGKTVEEIFEFEDEDNSRLKEFRFRWSDAWNSDETAIDTILETSSNGMIKIRIISAGTPYTIDLSSRENEFIQELEELDIKNWDSKEYYQFCEDGDRWMLYVTYDDVHIESRGSNGYPKKFDRFLNLLDAYLGEKIFLRNRKYIQNGIKGAISKTYKPEKYGTYA